MLYRCIIPLDIYCTIKYIFSKHIRHHELTLPARSRSKSIWPERYWRSSVYTNSFYSRTRISPFQFTSSSPRPCLPLFSPYFEIARAQTYITYGCFSLALISQSALRHISKWCKRNSFPPPLRLCAQHTNNWKWIGERKKQKRWLAKLRE